MKKALLLVGLLSATLSLFAQRASVLINKNWNFHLAGDTRSGGTVQVNLPHTWNTVDALVGQTYYRGVGEYEKKLFVPDSLKGKRLFIRFDGAFNVTDFFVSLNLPFPAQTAVFISCVEFFGGIFLAFGLLSRITALVLTINMVVAYLTADHEALLSVFSDPDKFYAAAPYTFLVAAVIILLFGPGKLALDCLIRRLRGTHPLQEAPAASR